MKRTVWAAGTALAALCAVPLIDWLVSGGGTHPMPSQPYAGRSLILIAFVPYAVALYALRRRPAGLRVVAGVGAACVLLLIAVPPRASQDVFSYLFYGRMWEDGGLNPYTVAPSGFAQDPWFAFVRWPDTPSAYGPLWTGLNGGFSAVAGSHLWIALALAKLTSLAGVVLGGVAISRLGRGDDHARAMRLAMLLWNPLLLFAIAGDGHVDGVLVGLIAAALWARRRERMGWATAALVAASLVKPYAGLFLLLHLGTLGAPRRAPVHAGAALGAAVAAYAPFWAGWDTFTGLRDVAARFSATPARELRRLLDALGLGAQAASGIVRALGVVAVVAVIGWALRAGTGAARAWGIAFATYLVVTPWFLPWHGLPLLALAACQKPSEASSSLTAGALVLSASSLIAVPAVRFGAPALAAWARHRSPHAQPDKIVRT